MPKNDNIKVKLKITDKHFEKGRPSCQQSCVVALALLDAWESPISRVDVVSDSAFVIRNVNQHRTDYYAADLPKQITKLIEYFDENALTEKDKHFYQNRTFTLNFRKWEG